MPSLNQIKQVAEVETRYTVSGEADVRRAMDGVASAQEKIAKGAEAVAVVTEKVEKRQLSLTQASERLRRELDEQFRQSQKLDNALGRIDRLTAAGQYDPMQADRLRGLAQSRYGGGGVNDNRPGANGGLSGYDKSFIKYQGFDVAASLGSGASPITTAFQQGPQILQQLADRDGGLSAGLKQLGVSAAALVTPFSVALVAATALGGGFLYAGISAGKEQEALERATKGIGAATGASAGQLDALARANAEAGKVSTSTARDMVATYNATGQIGAGVFGTLIQSTEKYARLTGQDATTATQELARAFGDLTTGAEAIAAKIGGLDDKTRQLIQTQIEQGDKAGAQATAGEYLRATVDANSVATTGWAAAWDRAKVAADGYWEAAKRIAGIKLGVAPEGAAAAVERLTRDVDAINNNRRGIGMGALDPETSLQARELQVAQGRSNQERLLAEADAARERAAQASRIAGNISRATDPNFARLSELRTQQSQLSEALADPMARARLSDFSQTETAYLGVTRAIETMVDANGRLVSSEEMTRRGNQLQLDAVNAKTDAEKALVAQRQKAFDLIGKAIPGSDARSQIDMAGRLALASAAGKSGGSSSDSRDEYDRAIRSAEDRIRRQQEEAATFGMGAEAVARYRTQTDLLTAAKRAERDVTPELTAQIQGYADKAAAAAAQQEKLRDSMREMDGIRSAGREVFGSIFNDLSKGSSAATTFENALSRIQNRILDMASTSLTDALFGRSGTSGAGLLGGLFGGSSAGGNGASSGSNPITSFFSSIFGGAHADGGLLSGPGGPRTDNLLIRASPGEYVINAASVAHYGRGVFDGLNTRSVGRYADGGMVGSGYSAEDVRAIARSAPAANANSAPPSITFVTPPGMALEQDGPPRRQADGSYEQVLRTVEKGLGGRAANQRGPFQGAVGGAWARKG